MDSSAAPLTHCKSLIIRILRYLSLEQQNAQHVHLVCHLWNKCANVNYLWKLHSLQRWPEPLLDSVSIGRNVGLVFEKDDNWKKYYDTRIEREQSTDQSECSRS